MTPPTATTQPRTIVTTLVSDAELKLTKAQKRAQALTLYRAADDAASIACDERKSTKDAALDLCDDGKTYKDTNGKTYVITKTTDSTDYSGTVKWATSAANPLGLDAKQLKALAAKLESTKKPKAHGTPIKRID